jgi:hypothetical protein
MTREFRHVSVFVFLINRGTTLPVLDSMWAPKIWKLGLTGGIGSGKSNVAKVISTFGVPVIDADKLGIFASFLWLAKSLN